MDYLSRKGTVQMSRGELIFRKIPKDRESSCFFFLGWAFALTIELEM